MPPNSDVEGYHVEWIGHGNSIEFFNDDPVVYDTQGEGVAYCKDAGTAERIARLLNEDDQRRKVAADA